MHKLIYVWVLAIWRRIFLAQELPVLVTAQVVATLLIEMLLAALHLLVF